MAYAESSETRSQVSFNDGFAPVARKALPAVVNIASSKTIRFPGAQSPFFSDPFFRQFFGDEFSGVPRGALVADVTPHSPAERSGLNKGDIILELNGAPLGDSQELRLKISMMAPLAAFL